MDYVDFYRLASRLHLKHVLVQRASFADIEVNHSITPSSASPIYPLTDDKLHTHTHTRIHTDTLLKCLLSRPEPATHFTQMNMNCMQKHYTRISISFP